MAVAWLQLATSLSGLSFLGLWEDGEIGGGEGRGKNMGVDTDNRGLKRRDRSV